MKLDHKLDKIMFLGIVFMLAFVFGVTFAKNMMVNTYAETEDGIYEEAEEHFVTFYDNGEKLTIKTTARTVKEALDKAGYQVNMTDKVEPGLDTKIDRDNFFINIYRSRPALLKVGLNEKYVMTASSDPKTILKEAGITVYDGDEIKVVENASFLETGVATVYEVVRNGGRSVTVETEIPFTEREVKDYNLAPGQREVRQLGEMGRKVSNYEVLYVDGEEVSRELISEAILREPVEKIVAVGAEKIAPQTLTASRGAIIYTVTKADGSVVDRKETYYDLDMSRVMANAARTCGVQGTYRVREDGVKVDADGYVLVAANLSKYPRCSVVQTSVGPGKVYDTGGFASYNPEQFDIATDWTNNNGK
ncbi:G5 domain-containing protein [Candidatus Saccharibacteria bacterium]|nr:G5 domain-containing protein [Candidatus Saccharibacteria bacterium]